jgi:hypothetical protein
MMIGKKSPKKVQVPLAPKLDRVIAVAIGNRAADRQKQHFRQGIGNTMRLSLILDPRKTIQKRAKPRFLAKTPMPDYPNPSTPPQRAVATDSPILIRVKTN